MDKQTCTLWKWNGRPTHILAGRFSVNAADAINFFAATDLFDLHLIGSTIGRPLNRLPLTVRPVSACYSGIPLDVKIMFDGFSVRQTPHGYLLNPTAHRSGKRYHTDVYNKIRGLFFIIVCSYSFDMNKYDFEKALWNLNGWIGYFRCAAAQWRI